MKSVRPWVAVAAALVLGAAIGTIAGAIGEDDDGATRLGARVASLEQSAERLQQERNRLRLERNQLEARLAADEAPAVCPERFVSTDTLLPFFSVDYPCGWHAVHDPRIAVTSAEDREGLAVELLLLSRVPLSLAPRGGPVADVELADWTDDPADDEDRLPSLQQWVTEERERFESLARDDRFEAGAGATVHRLVGAQELFDEAVEVHILLWEYVDPINAARHVLRAFAAEPNMRAAEALERLARSFHVVEVGS